MAEGVSMRPSPSLALFLAGARVAARALSQLRTIVEPCRAIRLSALPNRAFMVERNPCAVTVVASEYPLPVQVVGHRALRVEHHSTASEEADVPQVMGDARDRARL